MLKRLVTVACSLVVAVGAGFITAAPAQATSYITICNSSMSDDNIHAYRTQSPFTEATIGQGNCVQFNDTGGYAKVDVDLPGEGDIHKYRRAKNTDPWESWICHDNDASDPYSGSGTRTLYWTSIYYCV
jgi:hypothetical protein